MNVKRQLKSFCPPAALELLNDALGRTVRFSGPYPSWEAASGAATGYAAASILERAIDATSEVISGKAASERDGVTFNDPNYPYPLISFLLMAAAENDGQLTVLDFGGALGSTYLQCRVFLKPLKCLRWCVVEQPHFVVAGRRLFMTDQLSFYQDMGEAWHAHAPDVVLFSSSLQYLPEPYEVLRAVVERRPGYIIMDRNPFIESDSSAIALQKTPKQIVASSYPLWLFSESELRSFFAGSYAEIASFDAVDGSIGTGRLKAKFKGIVLKRIDGVLSP